MGRAFDWEDYWKVHNLSDGPDNAVLYGPEPYMIAAVIILDYGVPAQGPRWKVMSNEYRNLNFTEEDTSLPLEQLKKRTLIRLGQELKERKEDLDADLSCVRGMLSEDLPEGPYE